jgi:hypothetical protein
MSRKVSKRRKQARRDVMREREQARRYRRRRDERGGEVSDGVR